MSSDAPEWLSSAKAADYLGITPHTLYRLINEGGLPAYKFGRVIRLKQTDLEAFIEASRIEPGSLGHLYADPREHDDADTDDESP